MTARTFYLTLTACAGALVLAWLAPPLASAEPVWQAAGPGDAAKVDFHAIATYGTDATHYVVVAVGQDTSTGSPGPVIYRRVDGQWERQALPASLGSAACLNGLAVTATAAWAIGNSTGCATGTPVVLRFPLGGPELAKTDTAAKWEPVTPSAVTDPLSSIALQGATGYVGDVKGNIYSVDDASATTPVGAKVSATPQPTAVNGIALTDGKDLAAGDNALPNGGRVYEVASNGASPAQFKPDASGAVALVDVAATSDTPVAIEDGAYWRPDPAHQNLWTRYRPADTFSDAGMHLRGVDVAGSGEGTTAAIAGVTDAGGAAWLRDGSNGNAWILSTGGWRKYTGLGAALEDAAVVAPNDVWAAGAQGNVRHFAEPPPPPKQDDEGGTGGDNGSASSTGGGSTDTGTGAGTSSAGDTPHTTIVEQPAPKSGAPKPTPANAGQTPKGAQRKPTGRLMRDVRVRVVRGRLIITFRLTAPARVGARASTAGRVLGQVSARLLGPGKRSLVLRYRGQRPPTQLQLIVRPAGRATTTHGTTR
jgi:hypothetical protein